MSMEMNINEAIQKCNLDEVESKNYGSEEKVVRTFNQDTRSFPTLTVETRYRT